jgi:hypothetical protein
VPIRNPSWPYTETLIEEAPDEWAGMYALWAGDHLLHIGRAPDFQPMLKSALRAHLTSRCSLVRVKLTTMDEN